MGRAGAAAVAMLVLLSGCVAQPRWDRLNLPAGFVASRLVMLDTELIVAGERGDAPALVAVDGDDVRGLDVTPDSFYGARARLTSIVADGTELYALGGRAGGGHSNPRWTTWTGDADGLVEQPAPGIEVFGGWRDGGVTGIAVVDGHPLIVGGRKGASPGLDIAVWVRDHDAWVEQSSTGTALAATKSVLPFSTSVVSDGSRLAITGYAQHLENGSVTLRAAIWVGTPDTGWRRVDLPATAVDSRARAAWCESGRCVIVGDGDGELLAWSLNGEHAEALDLPAIHVGQAVIPAPVAVGDRIAVVAPNGGSTTILTSDADDLGHWASTAGPVGHPIAAEAVGTRLAVLTDQGLWRREL